MTAGTFIGLWLLASIVTAPLLGYLASWASR